MKILSLFSGIGTFEKALENLDIEHELVGFSEIDKYAIESYSAIHGVNTDLNLGDVSKIKNEDTPKADLVTYGFPCQDISIAGNQAGIKEGTRSGLLYEAERIINHIKPKFAIAENVKNLVSKRHREDFEKLLERLDNYGYNNYWEVLNAKDYGIPQNRERVFVVSIRKDIGTRDFKFPEPLNSGLRLKDLLEGEVEDKYYIESEKVNELVKGLKDNPTLGKTVCEQRTDEGLRFFKGEVVGTLRTIDSCGDKRVIEKPVKVVVREGTKKGYAIAKVGDSIDLEYPNSKTRRGRVGKEVAQTLTTSCNQATLQHDYKIRKLTPLECFRLMGFTDEDYWKARKALEKEFYNGRDRSNSQMYKMAGNSIVVDVLEGILKNLIN